MVTRGDDTVNGGGGTDYGEGGRGVNTVNGQGGDRDVSNVVDGDGNDFASGGDGNNDSCIIDAESTDIFGQPGRTTTSAIPASSFTLRFRSSP